MTIHLISSSLLLGAYLLGSLNSAIITCNLLRLFDPRDGGSGNPGATNVLRLHGRFAALLTLSGDLLKGFLPVLLAIWLARHGKVHDSLPLLCALLAVSGHIYPFYSGLRHGGKGVTTLFGTLCALHWCLGLLFLFSWLGLARISRYSSIASLGATALAAGSAPLILQDTAALAALIFGGLFLLILWRHRGNLVRLREGTENRIEA